MSLDVFLEYFSARQGARQKAEKERLLHSVDTTPWPMYGSNVDSHDGTFRDVLIEKTFHELVKKWEKPDLYLKYLAKVVLSVNWNTVVW